ncbi:hypothetical protein HDU98_009425 [Podochytrium sp. JEL0797]|nr:hypothetical protein HDU98_009425 [Podochytrium sp. JEL0797]
MLHHGPHSHGRPAKAFDPTATRGGVSFLRLASRLEVQKPTLQGHRGCVNTLAWNAEGTRLISGSDDCTIRMWDPYADNTEKLLATWETGHTANIFSAKFLTGSNDRKIASCAANGLVRYIELTDSKPSLNGLFKCHTEMTDEVLADPENPHLFFSCSDDGTVNQYDTRIATSCLCANHCTKFTLIDVNRSISTHPDARVDPPTMHRGTPKTKRVGAEVENESARSRGAGRFARFFGAQDAGIGVAAMSIHSIHTQYLAVGCSDDIVRVYDRRAVPTPEANGSWWSQPDPCTRGEVYSYLPSNFTSTPHGGGRRAAFDPHKITSLKFDPTGLTMDLLVSYSNEKVYLLRPLNGASDFSPESTTTPLAEPEQNGSDTVHAYTGHRNRQTMIKEAYFYGPHSECIMSGSDDGTLLVWEKATGKLINKVKSDRNVVNCVCPNPTQDGLLCVSGIDHDVKVLLPTREEAWEAGEAMEIEGEEEEEEDDGDLIPVPRDLLLLFLERAGVSMEDLLRGATGGADEVFGEGADEDEGWEDVTD